MRHPTIAEVRAIRLEDGRQHLSTCSVAGIDAFEERDEEHFGNRLVERLLQREPTLKTVFVTFENGDELRLGITIRVHREAMEYR